MAENTPLLKGRSTSSESKINDSKLYLAVFSAILGNFSFGYSLVYPSPVLPQLQGPDVDPRLRMGKEQVAWFGSIYTLGAAAGGLGAMLLNDLIGRKLSVAGGMTAGSIPVYISEISHKRVRGAMGSCPQITAVTGALALYALGLVLRWRLLAVVGGVPALLMVVLLVFMPSSPRRLIKLGREQQAEKALRWLRGEHYDTQVEINDIQQSINIQAKVSWSQLATPMYYRPILISVGMRFLQQMTGITPILVYMEPIFAKSKVSLPARFDAAIVGAFRLLLLPLTLTIISHTTPCPPGPTPLNLTTSLDYISHDAIGSALDASQQTSAGIIPLISTMVFILGYALGWGPITWLLMSEVLPLAFVHLVEDHSLFVPYLCFTVVCVFCLLFTAVCVPETRGRSLEEIENYFRTGRTFTITRSPSTEQT
ncbi:Solute carrier family 2 facilitated glucose transporter member 6 [Dissostichus eleginoides]|uniref:Solute carrier family 2 facilitated glucose transporter member 6 n=1 Tax=Dissostichus eleginoides TaxID=100907 RepID=A0AAD9B7F0_DISEL|nr:Solute carrier family 2 facilitated glucose transporter member 6 [Dissostichus eleginoides]